MKIISIILLVLATTAQAKHRFGSKPADDREKVAATEPQADFQKCESRVVPLSHKHFGARNRNAVAFHTMMACGGLEGDPVQGRNGWKSYLPACPVTPPNHLDWKQDPPNAVARYHPCAEMCFKHAATKSWMEIIREERKILASEPALQKYDWISLMNSEERQVLESHYPGQQCCYRRGKLITTGGSAGTPDIIFRSPRRQPIRFRGTGPLRAALFHEQFDVAIINEHFTKWPQGWQEYFQLGWAPTGLPGIQEFAQLPEDAPCTSSNPSQSAQR